jgi:hypothetical protein
MRPGRALTHLVRVFRRRARNVSLTRAFTRPFPHHLLCRAPSLGALRPALRKIPTQSSLVVVARDGIMTLEATSGSMHACMRAWCHTRQTDDLVEQARS